MATFILKWNPDISSMKMSNFERTLKNFPFGKLNWSVWDYDKVSPWDDFYMVRVGEGKTGIVMGGKFSSEAKSGEDWSGKGRKTYYCDLNINYIANPETTPIVTTEMLEKEIPDFDWRHGHSGLLLTDEQEKKLEKLFKKYEKSVPELIEQLRSDSELVVQKSAIAEIKGGEMWEQIFNWMDDEHDRYTEAATHDCVNLSFGMDYATHEFRLTVEFANSDGLYIVCRKLYRIETDLSNDLAYMSEFNLSKPYKGAFILESNGVKIVCGEVEFEKVTDNESDLIPVTI